MPKFKVKELPDYLFIEFLDASSANALSLESARQLAQIQKKFRNWKNPVVVASAHPTHFCSGGHLANYARLKSKAQGVKINREISRHLDSFAKWPAVKLALIEGDVLGGGMEWLGRFDFCWSTPHALFSFWQRRIGLSPGWRGGNAWRDKISESGLRNFLLEGRLLSAEKALSHGLIHQILPSWKIRDQVKPWAHSLAHHPSVNQLVKWTIKDESKVFASLWLKPEHAQTLVKWRKK